MLISRSVLFASSTLPTRRPWWDTIHNGLANHGGCSPLGLRQKSEGSIRGSASCRRGQGGANWESQRRQTCRSCQQSLTDDGSGSMIACRVHDLNECPRENGLNGGTGHLQSFVNFKGHSMDLLQQSLSVKLWLTFVVIICSAQEGMLSPVFHDCQRNQISRTLVSKSEMRLLTMVAFCWLKFRTLVNLLCS